MRTNWLRGVMAAVVLCAGVAGAGELLPGLQVRDNGYMDLSGVRLEVMAWDMKWGYAKQDALRREPGFPVEKEESYQVKGTLPVAAGGVLVLEQTLTKDGEALDYRTAVTSTEGVELRVLALCVQLPVDAFAGKTIRTDGKELALPAEFKSQDVANVKQVSELAIPLEQGTLKLTGTFGLYVQDQRQYKGNTFTVRIFFTPQGGLITDAKLDLKMSLTK